ncbi:hypothetical protein TRIUR3_13260 [Triticum urartu]|uniref:Uncharacterized protein n=1 Tax=Triticum urartu TaxID=4572 RepID=M8A6Z2_TRIUA|nr:hypothetical protein TRIUR3_13260 [Triticum urartu]
MGGAISSGGGHGIIKRQRRLLIAEADELAMVKWRQCYPQDVADENAFWAERTTRRHVRAAAAAAAAFEATRIVAGVVDDSCSSSAEATTPTSVSVSTLGSADVQEHATSSMASAGSPVGDHDELWTELDAFASPKLMDLIAAGHATPFSSTWEEPEEDGEMMRLWSFC